MLCFKRMGTICTKMGTICTKALKLTFLHQIWHFVHFFTWLCHYIIFQTISDDKIVGIVENKIKSRRKGFGSVKSLYVLYMPSFIVGLKYNFWLNFTFCSIFPLIMLLHHISNYIWWQNSWNCWKQDKI